MNSGPSTTNNSHSALIALVFISLLASLVTMALVVSGQRDAMRSQQELAATLVALRNTPAPMAPNTQQQPPATGSMMGNTTMPPASGSMPQTVPAAPAAEGWATMTFDGISISYPKNLSATMYEDEFFGGQRNLRISSSATRRVGINSTGFKGYELVLRRIDDQQYATVRKEATVNPRVSSFIKMCDGETCPDSQYIFTKNGKRYLIEVLYQMSPYQAGIDLNNKVIASIK